MQLHNEPCNNPKIIIKTEGHVYVPDIRCSLLNSDFYQKWFLAYITHNILDQKIFWRRMENFVNS